LIARGYSNKEIAKKINVAEQTVKNYVSNIYYKTGIHDRVQISIMAVKAGMDRVD
jgi:DNA-binding NarL/FixJ family response regulator